MVGPLVDVQAFAEPVMDQRTVPAGAPGPDEPPTSASNVIACPTVGVSGVPVTLIVGVAVVRLIEIGEEVALR